jgi:hypothetical protein
MLVASGLVSFADVRALVAAGKAFQPPLLTLSCLMLTPWHPLLVLPVSTHLQVLQLLIRLYEDCPEPDYVVICQCLMFLDDAPGVAKILNKLISSSGVSSS